MAARRKLNRVVKACIRDVARKAGVKLSVRNIDDQYVWNGKTIALLEANGRRRPDANIVHDIAHYIVASPKRRKHPEFGLGDSPDDGPPSARRFLTRFNMWREEEEVSLLGILIEKALKLDPNDTFKRHGWGECNVWGGRNATLLTVLKNFRKGERDCIACRALQRLLDKGHLDVKMRPKVLV